jgi:hypothetical protein
LITSTLLSLLVIPAVYTFVDDFKEGMAGGWWRKLTKRASANAKLPASPTEAQPVQPVQQ